MQISYERTGGFAGIRFHANINTEELPFSEAETLLELMDEINFFELPERMVENDTPDSFCYFLTVDDGERRHTVEVSAAAMSDQMYRLVNQLQQIARGTGR